MITKFKIFEIKNLDDITILNIGDYVLLKTKMSFNTPENFVNNNIGRISNINYHSMINNKGEMIPNYITVLFEIDDKLIYDKCRHYFKSHEFDKKNNIYKLYHNFSASDVKYYGSKEDVILKMQMNKYNI